MLNNEYMRFLLVGAYNTLFGYILYVSFLYFLQDSKLAYTLAYILAGSKSFYLYSKVVFKVKVTLITYILFPLGYLIQYIIGISLIDFFINSLKLDAYISGLLVLPFTVVVAYLYNKLIFQKLPNTDK